MPFNAVGRLHDHPINDNEEILRNQEDCHHQSVDCAGIKALLADLIKDKIQDKFYVCNIEGQLHDIRWDEPWGDNSDDESLPPPMGRQPSSDLDDSDDKDGVEDVGLTTSNLLWLAARDLSRGVYSNL
jgi:hypothetical protein